MGYTTRRKFLVTTGLGAAVTVPLTALWSRTALARDYGPLVSDPEGRLDLPEGFSYTIVEEVGDAMDDGYSVPGALDGMACFDAGDGTLVLLRNHELFGSNGNEPDPAYTSTSGGGVTRIVVDPETGEKISSNWVLAGTRRNCAGGPSPWGWLSCEENVEAGHGYVFLTTPDADVAQPPDRKVGYGRFNHEAVCIDPDTLYAYLTEDRGDGCLYRFVPDDAVADPFTGTLQAMRVTSEAVYATEAMDTGDMVDVDWVDVPDPDPIGDTVRMQAQAEGAANVRRGEGIWFWDGDVFFASTSGGAAGLGQIFRLTDDPETGEGVLECIFASGSADDLIAPDNITVSPWGQLFICEDEDVNCQIRAITADGDVISFAQNVLSQSELAGVCFSPDGTILFVNSQSDGITYAITGPFPKVPDPGGDDDTGTGDSGDGDDTGDPDGTTSAADGDSGGGGSGGNEGTGGGSTSSPVGDGSSSAAGSESGGDAGASEGDGEGCSCSEGGSSVSSVAAAAGLLALKKLGRD